METWKQSLFISLVFHLFVATEFAKSKDRKLLEKILSVPTYPQIYRYKNNRLFVLCLTDNGLSLLFGQSVILTKSPAQMVYRVAVLPFQDLYESLE